MLLLFSRLVNIVLLCVNVVSNKVWLEMFLELGRLIVLLIRVMGCNVRDFMNLIFYNRNKNFIGWLWGLSKILVLIVMVFEFNYEVC